MGGGGGGGGYGSAAVYAKLIMAMQLAHAEQLMHKIVTNLFTVLSVAGDSKLTGRT